MAANVERPVVSIITPVLNRAETIGTCLASIGRQWYDRIEHIVIDGGSTDGTVELLRDHAPLHPFRWMSEPDGGMYEAINKGIALAKGEIVAYLNSDDLYLPWSVDVAVRELDRETDLVYGDLAVHSAVTSSNGPSFYIQFYPDFDLRHYSFVRVIGQPTVFWRRALTERIGPFDASYRLIGDCEYWLRAAINGAVLKHVSEIMAVQVEHASTLRSTHPRALEDEFARLRRAMKEVVAPPASPRWETFKKSLTWRACQIEFFYAMRARHPHKWVHFVENLRTHGVDVELRDLRMLAPARWRGNASLFRKFEVLNRILGLRLLC
jgi:glycosyltransferase involved in cell wall biosynthesis